MLSPVTEPTLSTLSPAAQAHMREVQYPMALCHAALSGSTACMGLARAWGGTDYESAAEYAGMRGWPAAMALAHQWAATEGKPLKNLAALECEVRAGLQRHCEEQGSGPLVRAQYSERFARYQRCLQIVAEWVKAANAAKTARRLVDKTSSET